MKEQKAQCQKKPKNFKVFPKWKQINFKACTANTFFFQLRQTKTNISKHFGLPPQTMDMVMDDTYMKSDCWLDASWGTHTKVFWGRETFTYHEGLESETVHYCSFSVEQETHKLLQAGEVKKKKKKTPVDIKIWCIYFHRPFFVVFLKCIFLVHTHTLSSDVLTAVFGNVWPQRLVTHTQRLQSIKPWRQRGRGQHETLHLHVVPPPPGFSHWEQDFNMSYVCRIYKSGP